tara:strand:+ start:6272 stop:6781 length:510 start_codon:yes stop_codon:yes gene_type:complete
MSESPKERISSNALSNGFMLLEVLIALALFGMSAVFLVEGVGLVSKEIVNRKNFRDLEGDLVWIRAQVFEQTDYEKMEDGGDIQALTMGEVRWETEIEMTEVLDVFRVSLTLVYDGNDEFEVEGGEKTYVMYLFRPTWSKNSDFATERGRLLDEKRKQMEQMREDRRRL